MWPRQQVLDLANGVGVASPNDPFSGTVTVADAIAFLNNNNGTNVELNAGRLGFDKIDSWIGGLAEAHVPGACSARRSTRCSSRRFRR
jgi:hypothetical protein